MPLTPSEIVRRFLRIFVPLFVLVSLIMGVSYAYCAWHQRQYRAVFLTSGQVYFGKFVPSIFSDYETLTDIYYLQVNKPLQAAGPQQPLPSQQPQQIVPQPEPSQAVIVTKLGKELHGPQDRMYISSEQILFWEDLREDSDVVSTIMKDKNVRSAK